MSAVSARSVSHTLVWIGFVLSDACCTAALSRIGIAVFTPCLTRSPAATSCAGRGARSVLTVGRRVSTVYRSTTSSCSGVDEFLDGLAARLRAGIYRPRPLRRAYIPKLGRSGQLRPLGIPCVADRVVMGAVKIVLEPIFGKRRTTGMREGNERVLHRRLSESRWPRVMRWRPRGRSEALIGVHAGRAIEPRNAFDLGCRRRPRRRKATPLAAFSRAVSGPRGV